MTFRTKTEVNTETEWTEKAAPQEENSLIKLWLLCKKKDGELGRVYK